MMECPHCGKDTDEPVAVVRCNCADDSCVGECEHAVSHPLSGCCVGNCGWSGSLTRCVPVEPSGNPGDLGGEG